MGGSVTVKDLTPISSGDNFLLEIKINNNNPEKKSITINLHSVDNNWTWIETINGFETKNMNKRVDLTDEVYNIKIETPSEIYTQKLYPVKLNEELIEKPKRDVVIQTIIPQKKNVDINSISSAINQKPEIILFDALMGIVVMLLGLFAVKKRYV